MTRDRWWVEIWSLLWGALMGGGYGFGLRVVLGGSLAGPASMVMTAGFLVFGPFAIGYMTVHNAEKASRYRVWQWMVLPWLAVVVSVVLAALVLEGLICIVFALPIALASATLGGLAAGFAARRARKQSGTINICLAVLPLLIAPAESQRGSPLQYRTVQTQILISASAERVWANIERVPRISPEELPATWSRAIGFPRPREATLSYEGLGGVRHASFEGGLLFVETITQWKPKRLLCFTIRADTKSIPATTLDAHVTIGGRYFDVLNGRYEVEPIAPGKVLLHLSSEERLTTDFNGYAGLWSDAVMRDIQISI